MGIYKQSTYLILFVIFFSSCSLNRYSRNYTSPNGPRYSDFRIVEPLREQKDILKIVTYNIKCSNEINTALEIFQNNKELENADVLCLQEMDLKGIKTIAKQLKYNYVYYPSVIYKEKDFGTAILTKWPVLYDEKIILPHLNQHKAHRVVTSAILSINGKKVKVFSVHLGVLLYPNQRGDQIDKIAQSFNPNIDYYIIAGDFNTITKINLKTMLEPLLENYFNFVTKDIKWTYKHWYFFNKKAALDHILSLGMKSIDVGVIEDRTASDHIPVWAKFKMLKR